MGEAERVPISTPPSSVSPDPPKTPLLPAGSADASTPPKHAVAPSTWAHWKLLVLAALGATFGFLTGMGLWNQIHFHSIEFVLLAIPLGLAGYVLYDPVKELIEGREPGTELPERRGVAALATAALATLVISAFEHSLDGALSDDLTELADRLNKLTGPLHSLGSDLGSLAEHLHNWGGLAVALIAFACVGVAALSVTHYWVNGARHKPPRAAHYGAYTGLVFGAIAAGLLVLYFWRRDLLHSGLPWAVAGLTLFWFLVPGLIGGLAIHRAQHDPRPTRSILWYLSASSIVYVLLLLISAKIFEIYHPLYKDTINSLVWLPIVALMFQNLGWALGPYFKPESCDGPLCLTGTGAVTTIDESSPERTPGPMLVEFPGRIQASPPAASLPDDDRTSADRAKDMILKPKGDRLWATVAFVLALVTAALAYRLGSVRTDPELVTNIEQKLRQDSGLHDKPLTVRSTDKIVTIAGVVDNEVEHAKAVREASSIRGVRQLIDKVQVVPPVTPQPAAATNTVSAPVPAPSPAVNPTVSIGVATGSSNVTAVSGQKAQPPKAADARKHLGLPQFLSKYKTNQTSASDAQKTDPSKSADAQKKQGFFSRLLKKKDDNNNKTKTTKTPNQKNNNQ
jgi:hypothetical protein